MIVFKIDVVKAMRESGYNATRIRNEKLISQSSLQEARHGICSGVKTLNAICEILQTQPGLIIKWVPDKKDE